MSHGALRQANSIERTAQVCPPSHFDEERHLARAEPSARGGQTPGQTRPVKAVSRRSRTREPRALTSVGWSGSALLGAEGAATSSQDQFRRHIALSCCAQSRTWIFASWPMLERLRQASALSHDRPPRTLRFYPAIKRSTFPASPVLRYTSQECDRTKTENSTTRADSVLVLCSRYAGSSVNGTHS